VEVSTKERLTGALLVLLALVIVVPELLPGRHAGPAGTPAAQNPEDGAPLQTYNVRLDTAAPQPAAAQDVPAATAARMQSVPPPVAPEAAISPVPTAVASAPEKPVAAAGGKPPPVASTTGAAITKAAAPASVTPSAPGAGWWVQLGSFESRDNADRLAKRLRTAGFQIDVSQSRTKGKALYRVRAGPVADKAAASTLQTRLAAAGQKNSSLVAP
jgi:DedD protein